MSKGQRTSKICQRGFVLLRFFAYTVEPRYNGITNDVLYPSAGKICEKDLDITKPPYSEQFGSPLTLRCKDPKFVVFFSLFFITPVLMQSLYATLFLRFAAGRFKLTLTHLVGSVRRVPVC